MWFQLASKPEATCQFAIGELTDDAKGLYATDIIYDDTNVDQLESLPVTQLHRNVDLAIVKADKEGETDLQLSGSS